MKAVRASKSPERGCRHWRDPALQLVMGMIEVGGYRITREEVEEILSPMAESYAEGCDWGEVSPTKSLPLPLRRFLSALGELVVAVRREAIPDKRPQIHRPEDILLLFGAMAYREQELLKVLLLDENNRLLSEQDIAIGNANRMWVEPRRILRMALEWEAGKILILHNHPSGILSPGDEDIAFTRKMQDGCKWLGIKLLDHIILGLSEKKYFSFAENKIL